MSTGREDLAKLHYINALFARVTGSDLYLAEQIKAAIAFSLADLEAQVAADPSRAAHYDAAFAEAAVSLLAQRFAEMPGHGFYHWNAARTLTSATPLFAREEIMTGLKHLARFRESTLLVTHLRPALLPETQRSSPRRTREYEETLQFIRDLAAARTSATAHLQLLFL